MQSSAEKDQWIQQFEKSTEAVQKAILKAGDTLLLKKPGPDKWCIAEITEHLNISDKSAMIAMLRDGGEPTAEQTAASAEKVALMLAYNDNTWIAPEAATPKGKYNTVQEALDAFDKTRKKLLKFFQENELSHLAAGFEHPRLGMLSRFQWLQFMTWHANHHLQQMESILKTA
jgi:hypothetical protein